MKSRILKLYYNDLSARFTIHELAKRTGTSYSYVHGQIESLKKEKIIIVDQQSTRKYCSPNYDNPEMKSLFVHISRQITDEFFKKREKIFLITERLLSALPKKTGYNLFSIVLFGSLAKGTDSKTSDMDLFFIVPSKRKYDEPIEMECVALSRNFGIEINPIISEPKSFLDMLGERDMNVGKELLKNKIILFGAEKFWELVFEGIK